MLNATSKNISVLSGRSVLPVEKPTKPREINLPDASLANLTT